MKLQGADVLGAGGGEIQQPFIFYLFFSPDTNGKSIAIKRI
jgi:hypothetical protein